MGIIVANPRKSIARNELGGYGPGKKPSLGGRASNFLSSVFSVFSKSSARTAVPFSGLEKRNSFENGRTGSVQVLNEGRYKQLNDQLVAQRKAKYLPEKNGELKQLKNKIKALKNRYPNVNNDDVFTKKLEKAPAEFQELINQLSISSDYKTQKSVIEALNAKFAESNETFTLLARQEIRALKQK